jgi:hypothetical protein
LGQTGCESTKRAGSNSYDCDMRPPTVQIDEIANAGMATPRL